MYRDPPVRGDRLRQSLADQLVPEAVTSARDDQCPSPEGEIEQGKRLPLGQPGESHDADGVKVVAGHGQALEQLDRAVVEVDETLGDGIPDRRTDRQ